MRFLLSILIFSALVSGESFAAGQGQQYKNQIDLGGGYYVPQLAPEEIDVLRSRFDAQLPGGLDCSGLDLTAQLAAELTSGLSLRDLEAVGEGALAASAAYLAASFRPTWYETLQNAAKEANKAVQTNLLECRQIEQQLRESDPLDLYTKDQQATKTAEMANNGMKWGDAKKEAANSDVKWKLKDTVAKLDRPIERKANLLAVVGDISFAKRDGISGAAGDQTDASTLDAMWLDSQKMIAEEVRKRFNGEGDCNQPLFADTESVEARQSWLNGLKEKLATEEIPQIDRKEAWKMAVQEQLARKPERFVGCGAVDSWRADILPEDRATIIDLTSNALALDALGLTLNDADAELRQLKIENPNQAKVVDELSPLPLLNKSYADLKAEVMERERMHRALVLAYQKAEQERREAADRRRAGRTTYKGAPSPTGRF